MCQYAVVRISGISAKARSNPSRHAQRQRQHRKSVVGRTCLYSQDPTADDLWELFLLAARWTHMPKQAVHQGAGTGVRGARYAFQLAQAFNRLLPPPSHIVGRRRTKALVPAACSTNSCETQLVAALEPNGNRRSGKNVSLVSRLQSASKTSTNSPASAPRRPSHLSPSTASRHHARPSPQYRGESTEYPGEFLDEHRAGDRPAAFTGAQCSECRRCLLLIISR